jgi:DNA-binding response OmpR family regulator
MNTDWSRALPIDLLNLSNRTVMLVEDSPDLSIYITSILSKFYKVVQMPDGLAAWEYMQHTPPSLIIVSRCTSCSFAVVSPSLPRLQTDQMMPRMDGMSLVTAIRSNPATALLPVIMISAQAGSEARAEALERGLDDYLCSEFVGSL